MSKLFLIDGPTASGKSEFLRIVKSIDPSCVLAKKLTTRSRRVGDNDYEFTFVEKIPKEYLNWTFRSVGNFYAINIAALKKAILSKKNYILICTEPTIISRLKKDYDCIHIYVHRELTPESLDEVMSERKTANNSDAKDRISEVRQAIEQYAININCYDKVILNCGSLKNMEMQIRSIFQFQIKHE